VSGHFRVQNWTVVRESKTVFYRISRYFPREDYGIPRENPGGTLDAQSDDMMIAALIVGGLFVMGVVLGVVAVKTAPVGFQDEKGFHFGPEQTATHSEPTFAFEIPHAKAA